MRSVPVLAAAAVGAAAIVALVTGIILVASDDDAPDPSSSATPAATEAPARLGTAVDLRSGPSSRVAIVARLEAGLEVSVEGRDESGAWLSVRVIDDAALHGWVPRNAVIGAPDLDDLAVLASTPTATAVPTATSLPELPDLVVVSVRSEENRLVVTLANQGTTDVVGTIQLAIGETPAQPIEVKAGEPLIAGDQLDLRYEHEYVQRRGRVVVEASVEPPIEELSAANNRLTAVIAPDLENDLGITNALIVEGRGLVVSVRNNSPIPIVGLIALDVRQSPEDTLLGRRRLEVELLPEETIEVEFDTIEELDFTRASVQLSSDALDDARFVNNTFPR
jgi:hypothetical protein